MDQKIYYKKARDLGAIFGATFGFIKQNFKTLYGSILFFAGPFLLVGAAISSYMLGTTLGIQSLIGRRMENIWGDIIIAYFASMLVIFIGATVYNVILNRNILENEKLAPDEPLALKHATVNFWQDFWRILGNTLLLVIVMVVATIVLVLVFAGLFSLAGGGGGGGAVALAVLAVILFIITFLIFGPILAFVPMAALFICQRDQIGIFAAIGRVFYYMKNNFWNTWLVSMVGLLCYMVLGMLAQIPLGIVSVISTFSRMQSLESGGEQSTSVLLVIVTAISSLLSYCVLVIYHLIVIYQYTNLEEKKEGASIIEKINQIS